ncbi:MAG: hypothetical protein ABIJ28_03495 [Patescibacteria group bacterium]
MTSPPPVLAVGSGQEVPSNRTIVCELGSDLADVPLPLKRLSKKEKKPAWTGRAWLKIRQKIEVVIIKDKNFFEERSISFLLI